MKRWYSIPGYPGYKVDRMGDVLGVQGRVLKPWHAKRGGYPAVKVRVGGKSKTVMVHTLVLNTFVGAKPSEGHEACHHNGDPCDNRASNLYWGTRSDNVGDMLRHGTWSKTRPSIWGSLHHQAKLVEDQVLDIRARAVCGVNQHNKGNLRELADEFGVDYTVIWSIVKRKTWKHV